MSKSKASKLTREKKTWWKTAEISWFLWLEFDIFHRVFIDISNFRSTSSKPEKRSLENDTDDNSDDEVQRKKHRKEDKTKVTESILDDIRLEDIESRITVHVIESPESCTHEVSVYPGKST